MKILFVCMGNICRSPTAHGILEFLIKENNLKNIEVDSAGTHSYHIGSKPDTRSMKVAKENGVDISNQRARQVVESDFYYYDYLIALDTDNEQILLENAPKEYKYKVKKLLDYLPEVKNKSVPDPYYQGNFQGVYDLVFSACSKLLEKIT
ncbi:Low molecular weight protein tyrosine phosphatase [hydrothermal vent metagenome]|uniref:protein-tyrosine-phosphatase n=1 Tax=hydrothermal vent metagenome TaxID=652676 RepID=A0A1W1CJA5_9ZZZZ